MEHICCGEYAGDILRRICQDVPEQYLKGINNMIKKELRGKVTMVLCAVLAVSVCVMPVSAKSKKVRISRTSLTMEKGAKIRLKIKNAKKGIKLYGKAATKKLPRFQRKVL